jgi:hypothetical protein
MSEPVQAEALDFERADMAPEAARLSCKACGAAIAATYYGWGASYVCPSCHERLSAQHRKSGSFLRALVYGSAAAALGAGVYYGVTVAYTEVGLIAIFVGMGVGKAVRAGAGFDNKKRYRALAALLAYVSITATYIPEVLEFIEQSSVFAWVVAFFAALIAPVVMLASFDNLIGIVILGIGVYEAWKLSAAPAISVQGPFTLEAAAPAAAD